MSDVARRAEVVGRLREQIKRAAPTLAPARAS
jgi:hypothetical protein